MFKSSSLVFTMIQDTRECSLEEKTKLSRWQEEQRVSISSLSSLTGFPVEFIKKELLVDDELLSMKQLRNSMLTYLESNSQVLNN